MLRHLELHAGGDPGGDAPVGTPKDQDEAVGQRHSGAGNREFVRPFKFFGEIVGVANRVRHHRIDGEILGFDIVDGAKLDAVLPIEIEVERAHQGTREIGARGGVLKLRGTGVVVDDKGQDELVGEMRQRLGATPENSLGIVMVNALEIVEEIRSADATRNAEARPIGDGPIGNKQNAAVVVPDGFFVSG